MNNNKLTCFYCDSILTDDYEEDHFPIPQRIGGTDMVPCCKSCHDMKDRFTFEQWIFSESAFIRKISDDFSKLNREMKIFLAKTIMAMAEARSKCKRCPNTSLKGDTLTMPSLEEAINTAAVKLPQGWTIEISVSRGDGSVRLEGPNGNGVAFDGTGPLSDIVQKATARACK